MPRPKGSKNKDQVRKFTEAAIKEFVAVKRKGWPKGKKRGPRKLLENSKKEIKSNQSFNDKVDFKVLLIAIARLVLSYLKK